MAAFRPLLRQLRGVLAGGVRAAPQPATRSFSTTGAVPQGHHVPPVEPPVLDQAYHSSVDASLRESLDRQKRAYGKSQLVDDFVFIGVPLVVCLDGLYRLRHRFQEKYQRLVASSASSDDSSCVSS